MDAAPPGRSQISASGMGGTIRRRSSIASSSICAAGWSSVTTPATGPESHGGAVIVGQSPHESPSKQLRRPGLSGARSPVGTWRIVIGLHARIPGAHLPLGGLELVPVDVITAGTAAIGGPFPPAQQPAHQDEHDHGSKYIDDHASRSTPFTVMRCDTSGSKSCLLYTSDAA